MLSCPVSIQGAVPPAAIKMLIIIGNDCWMDWRNFILLHDTPRWCVEDRVEEVISHFGTTKELPSSSIPLIRPIDKSPGRNNENITLLVDGYLDYLHRLLLIGGHGKLSPKTTATSSLVIVARRITLYTFSVFSPAVLVTSSSSTQILVRIFIIILVDQASIPRGCFTFLHIHPLYIHTYSTWPATTTAPRRIHIYTILLLSLLSSPRM